MTVWTISECILQFQTAFVFIYVHKVWVKFLIFLKHQNEADDVWQIYKEGKWSESFLSSACTGPVLGVMPCSREHQWQTTCSFTTSEASVCFLSLSSPHLTEQNDVTSCELALTPPGGAVVSAPCAQSRNQLNQQNSIITGSVQLQWKNPLHWWAAVDLLFVMPTDGSEWIHVVVQQPDELHWSQTSACV